MLTVFIVRLGLWWPRSATSTPSPSRTERGCSPNAAWWSTGPPPGRPSP